MPQVAYQSNDDSHDDEGSYEYYDDKTTLNNSRDHNNNNNQSAGGGGGGGKISARDVEHQDMPSFFDEVAALQQGLREAHASIAHIAKLHTKQLSLPSADDAPAQQLSRDLREHTEHTRESLALLKARIRALEQGNANLAALLNAQHAVQCTAADIPVRRAQVDALRNKFKEAIQRYAQVEQDHRAKSRARLERQLKVVNPNISDDDVHNVVRDAEAGTGAGVFSQAVRDPPFRFASHD